MKKCDVCGREHGSLKFDTCYPCREKNSIKNFSKIEKENIQSITTLNSNVNSNIKFEKNKISNRISFLGNVHLILSIVVGVVIMFMKTETILPYTGSVITEWSPISLVYGIIVVVIGVITSTLIKGFSEVIENTYLSKLYQIEILNVLKQEVNKNFTE